MVKPVVTWTPLVISRLPEKELEPVLVSIIYPVRKELPTILKSPPAERLVVACTPLVTSRLPLNELEPVPPILSIPLVVVMFPVAPVICNPLVNSREPAKELEPVEEPTR